MKTSPLKLVGALRRALYPALFVGAATVAQAQIPIYSLNGTGGTGGGSSGVSVSPSISPAGSSALTRIAGNNDFTFGPGVNGVAGESIVDTGTYGNSAGGVLAGTMGNLGTLSQFTMTMWINPSASPAGNNERLLDISSGGTPTTGSADGNLLFFGINAGGGLQFYVNNANPNAVGANISTATVFNGGAAAINTWYFVALTFDSTAGSYLLYTGNSTLDSAALAYTYTGAPLWATGAAFGTSSSIFVANRPNGQRSFVGSTDDINIYNGALSLSQLQGIQDAQLVPEPGMLSFLGMALGLLTPWYQRRSA